MKQLLLSVVLGMAVVVGAGAEETTATNRIGIVNLGGFDEPLLGRISGHLATNLSTTPKVSAPRDLVGGGDLQAEAAALAPLVTGEVICVIGVAAMPAGVSGHGAVLPMEKVGVINATALKSDDTDEELYGRRLEKEAIRCVGLLLGMTPCPNPRCALFHYQTVQELDNKGRNYCPPCQVKFESLQAEQHLNRRETDGTP